MLLSSTFCTTVIGPTTIILNEITLIIPHPRRASKTEPDICMSVFASLYVQGGEGGGPGGCSSTVCCGGPGLTLPLHRCTAPTLDNLHTAQLAHPCTLAHY